MAEIGTYACLNAPSIKKIAMSAVALLTATGVLETEIPIRHTSKFEPGCRMKQRKKRRRTSKRSSVGIDGPFFEHSAISILS